jgi:putative transcriptional regulator
MDVGEMLRRMRAELALTQEQFALRFGFDLDALQNWEQGRRKPDRAISAYLRVIARNPDAAARAQEEEEPA